MNVYILDQNKAGFYYKDGVAKAPSGSENG